MKLKKPQRERRVVILVSETEDALLQTVCGMTGLSMCAIGREALTTHLSKLLSEAAR